MKTLSPTHAAAGVAYHNARFKRIIDLNLLRKIILTEGDLRAELAAELGLNQRYPPTLKPYFCNDPKQIEPDSPAGLRDPAHRILVWPGLPLRTERPRPEYLTEAHGSLYSRCRLYCVEYPTSAVVLPRQPP